MERYAQELIDAVDAVVAAWVVRCVTEGCTSYAGTVAPEILEAAEEAGRQARVEVVTALRALLDTDVDEQRSTPLTILRAAVRHPTGVLRDAGVPPAPRDAFAVRAFPADVYGLTPASFADVDPSLAEPGLIWGAAKAMEHRRRHRDPG